MAFIENYPTEKLIPADYNPRKIEENAFEKLKESIKKFGVIKPIIVNGKNNTLTAGHQRTKALKELNYKTVPVITLPDIVKQDEIMFNLFHNSIETSRSKVWIEGMQNLKDGYNFVHHEKVFFEKNINPIIVKEIGILIMKYGEWGSVVCSNIGNIILNSDYALACKLMCKPILVYKLSDEKLAKFESYFNVDYGEYNYDSLGVKDYNQTFCQIARLEGKSAKKSSTYEKYVIPMLDREKRFLDFGAGKCAYAKKFRKLGYKFFMYEPFYRKGYTKFFDMQAVIGFIKEIESDISKNGLYDVVVLDSVINSVTSLEMQHNVLLTCNALLRNEGIFIMGTRSLKSTERHSRALIATSRVRDIEFLDKDKFSVTFRDGVWTKQKFHTKQSLKALLETYFLEVEIYGQKLGSIMYAICKYPKKYKLKDYERVLNVEFNMIYPNNYKHNQHKNLIKEIITKLKAR